MLSNSHLSIQAIVHLHAYAMLAPYCCMEFEEYNPVLSFVPTQQ
jgi:hypothetical protein